MYHHRHWYLPSYGCVPVPSNISFLIWNHRPYFPQSRTNPYYPYSGVEIPRQIFDSWGVGRPTSSHCYCYRRFDPRGFDCVHIAFEYLSHSTEMSFWMLSCLGSWRYREELRIGIERLGLGCILPFGHQWSRPCLGSILLYKLFFFSYDTHSCSRPRRKMNVRFFVHWLHLSGWHSVAIDLIEWLFSQNSIV